MGSIGNKRLRAIYLTLVLATVSLIVLTAKPTSAWAQDLQGNSTDSKTAATNTKDQFDYLAGKYLYWIQLYSSAAQLTQIYFGYTPSIPSDLAEKGLVPYAPKDWDEESNGVLAAFYRQYGIPDIARLPGGTINESAPDTLPSIEDLRDRIKPVPLEQATPERILAYRWQLLARMPQAYANCNLKDCSALFFKFGVYGLLLSEPSRNYAGFGHSVKAFWTNPYTGERAKRHIYGEKDAAKGDLVFLPGSEYIRQERPGDMERIHDFYYLEAFIWVGADPNYGME